MKRDLPFLASLLAGSLFVLPVAGQGPPEEVPQLHWVSAARALDEETQGAVHWGARDLIAEQSERFRAEFGSAAAHGLRECHLAPEKFCTVSRATGLALGPDSGGDFGAALLLAEVAVNATVTDVVPGFSLDARVESLLELSDVVPLHDRSPIPGHVLVPVGRVVAEDRVFCSGDRHGFDPVVGTRVVIIGALVQGVVPMGPGPGNSTMFAVVAKDGESLHWEKGRGPTSLVDLQARVDEAVSGNLVSMTTHLARLREGTENRQRFGERWLERASRGCRLISVDGRSGEETEMCIGPEPTEEAESRFEKAWQQQCTDGGAPPIGVTERRGGRTRVDLCSRRDSHTFSAPSCASALP